MKQVTLSVPKPFSTGPQYDENGELEPGSWPVGLPHEDIRGWVNIGSGKGNLVLCEFVCEDDWPVEDIPGGWNATASAMWDMESQDIYNSEGELVRAAIKTEIPTDYTEYNKFQIVYDEEGNPQERTEETRSHVYLGWPLIRE